MRIFNLFRRKNKKVYLVMNVDNTEGSFSNVIAAFKSETDARSYSKSYSQKTKNMTYLCIVNLQ